MLEVARTVSLGLVLLLGAGCGPSPDGEQTPLPGDDDSATPTEVTPTSKPEATTPPVAETTAPVSETTPPEPETTAPGDDDTTVPVEQVLETCDDRRDFWAWDLSDMPPRSVPVSATCRFMGPGAYLYVADDQWETNVTEEAAREFMITFEFEAGPQAWYPNKGLLDNDRAVFGELPDALDNDPRLYVLLLDLADYTNADGETWSFDGYFDAYNQLPDAQVQRQTLGLYHSNEIELLYLNSRVRPISDPYTLAVGAHELQHCIAWNYDTAESVWMSEALAEAAMLVNGLFTDIGWVRYYASVPETPLVTNGAAGNYGAFLLWGMYLLEQLGPGFILPLESEQQDGIVGLNRALSAESMGTDFATLYADWIVANAVQDLSLGEGQYGYDFSDELPDMARETSFSGPGGTYQGELLAFAANYIDLDAINSGSQVTVTSEGKGTLLARLVRYGLEGTTVETLDESPRGGLSANLEGGKDWHYLLVLSNVDSNQVDTEVALQYSVTVGE